ncbi:MAG: sugar ABC transporter permease [Saccharofermentans sp.]|nr:sugar ABC transporter permease [Saccharofermentans sp.]
MNNKKLVSYSKYGYIFAIPFVLTFLIFTLYPIIYTFTIGFTDLRGAGATELHFMFDDPFKNFRDVLTSDTFQKALTNTVRIWVVNFIPQIAFALLFTAWFTDRRTKLKGQGIFKILFYLPNIITSATVAILFLALFGYPKGPANDVIQSLGMEKINFTANATTVRGIVAFIQFWMWYGYTMVNLIAGVIGINPEIFEAAELDGANKTQTFFLVTIPCIRSILVYVLVTSLIGGLNMFDIPEMFIGKNCNNAALTTNMYIRNQAFLGSYLYARAAAASVIMFLIILVLCLLLLYFMRDRDEAKLAKLRRQERKAAAGRI